MKPLPRSSSPNRIKLDVKLTLFLCIFNEAEIDEINWHITINNDVKLYHEC